MRLKTPINQSIKKANWEKLNILCHEKLMFDNFLNSEDPIFSFTETLN